MYICTLDNIEYIFQMVDITTCTVCHRWDSALMWRERFSLRESQQKQSSATIFYEKLPNEYLWPIPKRFPMVTDGRFWRQVRRCEYCSRGFLVRVALWARVLGSRPYGMQEPEGRACHTPYSVLCGMLALSSTSAKYLPFAAFILIGCWCSMAYLIVRDFPTIYGHTLGTTDTSRMEGHERSLRYS